MNKTKKETSNTNNVRSIHGNHAITNCLVRTLPGSFIAVKASTVFNFQVVLGFQNRSNTIIAVREHSEATISTSHGP